MMIRIIWFTLWLILHITPLRANLLAKQFEENGYIEIYDQNHGSTIFDELYKCFDELIDFLQKNPLWENKLYYAKERFIRSKGQNHYSTDFFGFYDESNQPKRRQISFYYATHLHEFINQHDPKFKSIPQINIFLEKCLQIQKDYSNLFIDAANTLDLAEIFEHHAPPILFKVVKYLPNYIATQPHYDGTAFSLLLDSTDNQALLISPYKQTFTVSDFKSPIRKYVRTKNQNSILLIPGTLLSEFSINPTPHIIISNHTNRYATIAFAMRPNLKLRPKNTFSILPNFKD